ncbi:MAG: hypothetical protein WC796_01730 [Candidatus Pacearchaeota archaeon]|jgi:hypothetical protein
MRSIVNKRGDTNWGMIASGLLVALAVIFAFLFFSGAWGKILNWLGAVPGDTLQTTLEGCKIRSMPSYTLPIEFCKFRLVKLDDPISKSVYLTCEYPPIYSQLPVENREAVNCNNPKDLNERVKDLCDSQKTKFTDAAGKIEVAKLQKVFVAKADGTVVNCDAFLAGVGGTPDATTNKKNCVGADGWNGNWYALSCPSPATAGSSGTWVQIEPSKITDADLNANAGKVCCKAA